MIKIFKQQDLIELEKQLRTNLINSLPGIRQANLIGTINNENKTNVAIFNSVMHIGANPPLMGFIMRPVDVERHTYQNIKQKGCFTINHVSETIYKQAHQTSAKYDISEFDATGLESYFSSNIEAPYVKQSPVKIGLSFEEELLIKSNHTILIVGKIIEIIIDDNDINEDNIIQLNKTKSVGVNGLETYYKLEKISQLPYARP